MRTPTQSMFEQAVLPLFEEHRADWLARAREAALKLVNRKGTVTIDDVRDVVPPPHGLDPRVMGGVFKRGTWELVGYEQSRRVECHKRPIGRFRMRAGV